MQHSIDAHQGFRDHGASKAVVKYLEYHAEPEAKAAFVLAPLCPPFATLLVIPAYGEDESLSRVLASIPSVTDGRVLVVVVVNERSDAPEWARDANRHALHKLLSKRSRAIGPATHFDESRDYALVTIDRTGPRALPPKQGVGLARKLGADFALALWAAGGCTKPWIYCTDADAVLPADYFDRTGSSGAAQVFDFRHDSESGDCAILEYEIYLRYGVLGLHAAHSPWAWHAIGSTLSIDMHAYAQVRGFPRRQAAEDFHMLAKLAKVGKIHAARGTPIRLCDRASTRVPFGTGHAMRRAQEQPRLATAPQNYAYLAAWLETLDRIGADQTHGLGPALADAARQHKLDDTALRRALDSIGAIESAEKVLGNRTDLGRSLNENFDALATLRLLHALRDHVHCDVSLSEAIATAPFLDAQIKRSPGDLEATRDALIEQERRCLP